MQLVQKYSMSVNEVFVLKGIAILMIMFHNFAHKLPGMVQENQHFFLTERCNGIADVVANGGPHLFVNLISHYGHYGVAVFVFLCGYGLALKYTKTAVPISFGQFALKHAKKLWLLMLPLLLPHFLFFSIKNGEYFIEHIADLVMMVTFTSGFNPEPYVFHGPWWFFSLIFQLYVVYYLAVYGRGLKPLAVITAASLALQVVTTALGTPGAIPYLSRTFVGYMLPFAAGVVFARKGVLPTTWFGLFCLVIFFACGFNEYTWLLTFALVAVALLPLERLLRRSGKIYSALLFVGVNSAYVFVIHPIVRSSTMDISDVNIYLALVVYGAVSITVAYYYKRLLLWVKQKVTKKRLPVSAR